MAYAEVTDVALRLGREVTDLNQPQVQALLDDVSALVNAYTGIDFTLPDPETGIVPPIPAGVKWVVVSRVIRALSNPDGIRQETIGTYSYSLAVDPSAWTGEERMLLDAYGSTRATRGVGSFGIGYREGAAG